ncbi:hypothetical protein [Streptomyces sp. NPDC056049]|uniref:hypothetical protein n=1 Tax=Streptomyces sp. NPDC056049 TaxID=3345693 RepID=UPI0035E05D3A
MGSWRNKPWLLWAALMVPAAATIAGIGTYTGVLGPEDAPRPSRADLVGRYEDGEGGVVVLRDDWVAELSGIEQYVDDGFGGEVPQPCEDAGAGWTFAESRPRWHHQVAVLTECGSAIPWLWDVDGSPSRPELIYWLGTPGHPDARRVLTRR